MRCNAIVLLWLWYIVNLHAAPSPRRLVFTSSLRQRSMCWIRRVLLLFLNDIPSTSAYSTMTRVRFIGMICDFGYGDRFVLGSCFSPSCSILICLSHRNGTVHLSRPFKRRCWSHAMVEGLKSECRVFKAVRDSQSKRGVSTRATVAMYYCTLIIVEVSERNYPNTGALIRT